MKKDAFSPACRFLLTLMLLSASWYGWPSHAAEPGFVRVQPFFDEHDSGGLVDLEVRAEPGSMITLEYADQLPGGNWTAYASPVVVSSAGTMVFSVPVYDEAHPVPRRFFRFRLERYHFNIGESGNELVIATEQRVPAALLFD
jgi:hypothetical protein